MVSAVLMMAQPASIGATNAYDTEMHWEQDPGGGLNRWVPYKDRTNHDVFGNWYQHNMTHYYESDNYWRPYRVSSDEPSSIVGKSYWDAGEWWGFTGFPDTNAPASHRHVYRAVSEFNDRTMAAASDFRIHTLMCHEIGHAGGLNHNPLEDSCMFQNHFLATNEDFTNHDRREIKRLHDHSD